jgi:hypothetical protein
MTWTVANLVIQLIAGILGGHAAAALVKEHSFGWLGHTVAGAAGGAFSGYFLQTLAATVVTASGSLNQPTVVENGIIQGLAGLVAGGVVMLVVGLAKHGIEHHRSHKH